MRQTLRSRDEALAELRRAGTSPMSCIKAIAEVEKLGIVGAKRAFSESPSWSDYVRRTTSRLPVTGLSYRVQSSQYPLLSSADLPAAGRYTDPGRPMPGSPCDSSESSGLARATTQPAVDARGLGFGLRASAAHQGPESDVTKRLPAAVAPDVCSKHQHFSLRNSRSTKRRERVKMGSQRGSNSALRDRSRLSGRIDSRKSRHPRTEGTVRFALDDN